MDFLFYSFQNYGSVRSPVLFTPEFTQDKLVLNISAQNYKTTWATSGTLQQIITLPEIGDVVAQSFSLGWGNQLIKLDNSLTDNYKLKYIPVDWVRNVTLGVREFTASPSTNLTCDITLSDYELGLGQSALVSFQFNRAYDSFALTDLLQTYAGTFSDFIKVSPSLYTAVYTPLENSLDYGSFFEVVIRLGRSDLFTTDTVLDGSTREFAQVNTVFLAGYPFEIYNAKHFDTFWQKIINGSGVEFNPVSPQNITCYGAIGNVLTNPIAEQEFWIGFYNVANLDYVTVTF